MRLRKTLPEDIEQIIASGDVEAVARAVERCEVGAYLRGSAYESRLMHFPASEEITDFLLARGEDINSRDRYERTPIHARVRSRCLDQIPMLIARGGDINARDTSDQTALFGVVERFPVADVSRMIAWGADPMVVADSRVYGKATLVENAVSWHNFLDAPRALAVIRLLLSVGAPVGERVPIALRAMDRMRCTFITHGLPDHLSQSRVDEASAAVRACSASARGIMGSSRARQRPVSDAAGRGHSHCGAGWPRSLRQRRHQLGSFFWGAAGSVSDCRAFRLADAALLRRSRRGCRRLPEGAQYEHRRHRRDYEAGGRMGPLEPGPGGAGSARRGAVSGASECKARRVTL